MHAEPVVTDPAALRWVVSERLPVGRLNDAPGDLGALLREGVIAAATVEPHAVVLRLSDGYQWSEMGERIRRALTDALGRTGGWDVCGDDDAIVRQIVDEVLAGNVGDFVRSHGGEIDTVSVSAGVVEVELKGACRGCRAAGDTLHQRLETAIRARYPDLVEVRDTTTQPTGRGLWPRLRSGLRP